MRFWLGIALVAAMAGKAWADCPDCVGGGGPAKTDCFIEWRGLPATLAVDCADGGPSDADGVFDGVCTVKLTACVNVSGNPSCTPGSLSGPPMVKPKRNPIARALGAALATLAPDGEHCMDVMVPIPTLLLKKPVATKLVITARSAGRKDVDKLKFVAQPETAPAGAPVSLANDVQPILTARCAIPTCHSGPSPSAGQNLEAGQSFASDVNHASTNTPKLLRVKPSSVRDSYMSRKITGQGIIDKSALMPQGCPGLPPSGGCATPAEVAKILTWIAEGAPDN